MRHLLEMSAASRPRDKSDRAKNTTVEVESDDRRFTFLDASTKRKSAGAFDQHFTAHDAHLFAAIQRDKGAVQTVIDQIKMIAIEFETDVFARHLFLVNPEITVVSAPEYQLGLASMRRLKLSQDTTRLTD